VTTVLAKTSMLSKIICSN